jgi:hypothetical protein
LVTRRTASDPATARRRAQLREAKRAQRSRDREAGLAPCQVKVRPATGEKLRRALALPGFEERLVGFLEREMVDVEAYPELKLLCWNRGERYIGAREALALYERHWRFVDQSRLQPAERALIERLARDYGNGLLHA